MAAKPAAASLPLRHGLIGWGGRLVQFARRPPSRLRRSAKGSGRSEIAIKTWGGGHSQAMATVLGAGSVLGTNLGGPGPGTAWFLDAPLVPPGRRSEEGARAGGVSFFRPGRAQPAPVDPPETLDLLA